MTKRKKQPEKPRLVLRREAWPAQHRDLFEAGLRAGTFPRSRLDPPAYAATVRPHTIRNAERGWGRFLCVLAAAGRLDPSAAPAACVTPRNVRQFLAVMEVEGNTGNTILTRFHDLRAALRVMQPDLDFSWLTKPGGVPLRNQLDIRRKPKKAMDSTVLLAWGIALMDEAPQRSKAPERLSQYRNGLIVVILTLLAPRLRTLATLRLGRNLVREGRGYRLMYRSEDMKEKNRASYRIPEEIVPYVDHYLDVVRPALLGERPSEWLWLHAKGRRFGERGIEKMIWRGIELRFGEAFGPHSFRHALSTTLATIRPDLSSLAAIILANQPETVETYYNHAPDDDAAAIYVRHIEQERRQTARRAHPE